MEIKILPIEIQNIVFKRQQENGNDPNPNMDLEDIYGNFDWDESEEGSEFWEGVNDGHFDGFYEKYPNTTNYEIF